MVRLRLQLVRLLRRRVSLEGQAASDAQKKMLEELRTINRDTRATLLKHAKRERRRKREPLQTQLGEHRMRLGTTDTMQCTRWLIGGNIENT